MQLYDPPKVFEIVYFVCFWVPLGVAKPLGIWYEGACQILAVGDALAPELWPFLGLMSNLVFLILDIFKVYGGILGAL